jgi:ribonuclease HI
MIDLYTDGGVIARNPSPIGGTWAFRTVDSTTGQVQYSAKNWFKARSGVAVSNNVAELRAMVEGLTWLLAAHPWERLGTVYSDSMVTLIRVFRAGQLNGVPTELVQRLQVIQKSGALARLRWVLVKGHPTRAELAAGVSKKGLPVSIHNVACDRDCKHLALGVLEVVHA